MKSRITTIISVNSLILSLCFILVPRFWCWPLVVIHNCIQFIISFLFLSLSFLPSKWSVSIWVGIVSKRSGWMLRCSVFSPSPSSPISLVSLFSLVGCAMLCRVRVGLYCLFVSVVKWRWNGGFYSMKWPNDSFVGMAIHWRRRSSIDPSFPHSHWHLDILNLSLYHYYGITDTVHHWTHLLLFILPSPYLSSISSHSSSVLISSGTTHWVIISVFSDTIGNYRIVVSSSLSSALSSRWFGFGMFVCRRHREKNSEAMMAMEQPLPLHSFIIFHLLANGHSHHSPSVILVPGVVMCLQLIICPSLKFKYSKFEIYID